MSIANNPNKETCLNLIVYAIKISIRNINNMERGSIYFLTTEQHRGCEQKNPRPIVIVSNNIGNYYSPTVIACGITSAVKKDLPTHVKLTEKDGGLYRESTILCEQIFTVDKRYLGKYMGAITNPDTLKRLNEALKISLNLQEE